MDTKMKKSLLAIATAATALTVAFGVSAAWNSVGAYGKNVVWFDGNNPDKILFVDQVWSSSTHPAYATDRTAFDDYSNKSATTQMWHVSPDVNFKPGGKINAVKGGVYFSPISLNTNVIVTHVNASSPADCVPGGTGCAWVTKISGSSSCTYARVKTTLSGEIGATADINVPVKDTGSLGSAGVSLGVTREWEKGWQACQSEEEAHSCRPGDFLNFNSQAFATSEARSKFGSYEFRTAGTKFWFKTYAEPGGRDYCINKIGGVWTSQDSGSASCGATTSAKPKWKRYERLPIPDTTTVPQIAARCRYIKR
jgi:hypothetical protein